MCLFFYTQAVCVSSMLGQLPSPKRPTIYQQSNLFKELQNKKHLTNVQRYSNNRAGTKIKTYLTYRNQNGRTPKSSILMGFSLINHSTIGVPSLLWKPPDRKQQHVQDLQSDQPVPNIESPHFALRRSRQRGWQNTTAGLGVSSGWLMSMATFTNENQYLQQEGR